MIIPNTIKTTCYKMRLTFSNQLNLLFTVCLSIGESPSKYPFLKNNGSEAPKGPRIHYFSGMDTFEDFLRLKIHHTLAPLFRYNKRF